jgi:hypothetical protein
MNRLAYQIQSTYDWLPIVENTTEYHKVVDFILSVSEALCSELEIEMKLCRNDRENDKAKFILKHIYLIQHLTRILKYNVDNDKVDSRLMIDICGLCGMHLNINDVRLKKKSDIPKIDDILIQSINIRNRSYMMYDASKLSGNGDMLDIIRLNYSK